MKFVILSITQGVYCIHLICTKVSTILLHDVYLYCFVERFWPLKSLRRCPECHQEGCSKVDVVTECRRVLITSQGTYSVYAIVIY